MSTYTLPTAAATMPLTRTRTRVTATGWWAGATATIWGTSLFVVALWVAGGGLSDLVAGPGPLLDSLGRITGLVAANLLLYQVLLMARVPLFERGFGHDGITRMHRLVGFWSLWLMLAHVILITVGYAWPSGAVITEFVSLTLTYPGMLIALAGTVAIIAVAITSMRAARRRLRYESWHLLHLYGYIGVGIALPHQLWTGSDFLTSPTATAYWWALWALTAVAVIVFRVLVPILRNRTWQLRVAGVERSGPDAVTLTIAARPGVTVPVTSGQFFIWRVPGGPGRLRGTPLSVTRDPDGSMRVTARVTGSETARLARLNPGDRLWAEGPFGTLTAQRRRHPRTVMFGAGSGVSPLVAILESERLHPGEAVLVTRDHAPGSGVMPVRVQRLVDDRGVRVFALDGRRSPADGSWLPARYAATPPDAMLTHLAGSLSDTDVFIVGPPAWSAALKRDLRAAGVARADIHTENFAI
ncbi:ferredoxin reductase family protein [Microbacterium gorillae]|uniref:ferredoxin reductase family protein n=1 Tax=Microbacterium gorillae TaxID=1231063 RepID=UPI00059117AC|nr:ferredoxin reductase family protein [Microbacterium gorillae]